MATVRKSFASVWYATLGMMRMQAGAELAAKMKQRAQELMLDPMKKLKQAARREDQRWGRGGGHLRGTGKRQSDRIVRQVLRCQLNEENGMSRESIQAIFKHGHRGN